MFQLLDENAKEIKALQAEIRRLKRFAETDADVIESLTNNVNRLELEIKRLEGTGKP
jgi:predicted  nucleic acid-binding Zn-ribbon protein